MPNDLQKIALSIILALGSALCHASSKPQILISADEISEQSEELFVEGKISVDLQGNGDNKSTINYSYNKIGPPNFENGNDKISEPVITIDIDTPKENLKISYLCSSIGIYKEKNNGYRDIFCGPSFRLKWNGSEYSE